jgi:MoaA/NifB/PqqE/SkfB family radical SAM enzyme
MLKYCSAPYEIVNINENGDVKFCICPSWAESPANLLGNYNDNVSLKELFCSDQAQEFRKTVTDQSYKFCYRNRCPDIHNLKEINDFSEINHAPDLPIWVILNIDKNCNLKCGSCRDRLLWSKTVNLQARRILTKLSQEYQNYPDTVRIRCDGLGDIFVSEAYRDFFQNASLPKCFKFEFTTNGNLITKNLDIIDKLGDQLSSVTITFDAATAETYKKVRGGKFQLILDGVQALVHRGITVTASFVTQRNNYRELLMYRDLTRAIGVEYINISLLQRWSHQTDTYWLENRLIDNPAVDYDWLIETLQKMKADPTCQLDGGLEKVLLDHQGVGINGPIWEGGAIQGTAKLNTDMCHSQIMITDLSKTQ